MARDKYGIIKLDLKELHLNTDFGDLAQDNVTSLLSEEQKEIIRTLGGSKLVYLKGTIIDSSTNRLEIDGFANKSEPYLYINAYDFVNDKITTIGLHYESGDYYIYA